MKISAKADYAVRAVLVLAEFDSGELVTTEELSRSQGIPPRFLENIVNDLRRDGIVVSRRGPRGGHRLARDPNEITVADIVRAVDGPLVFVNGERPSDLSYSGAAVALLPVWVAVRASVRQVLERVTIGDIVRRDLPAAVLRLVDDSAAWENRQLAGRNPANSVGFDA